jgi:maleylacetoacetate isomerase
MAIAEYLEETCLSHPLLPKDPLLRAKIRQICMLVIADIQPLQNLAVLDYLQEDKRQEWAKFWIQKGLQALEKIVSDNSGPYATGKQFTLADAFLYPQLRNAHLFDVDFSRYPRLLQIEKLLTQPPAVIKALNDQHSSGGF